MPVINAKQPSINLDSFSKAAGSSPNENKRLQLKDGGVSVAGAWSKNNPAANRQAIEAFSKALKAKYGEAIFNMASIRGILTEHAQAGKPLTGRMATDMIRLAREEFTRVNAHNASVVERFLSGQDKGGHVLARSLERTIAEFCRENSIPPENKADVQSRVQAFLQAKVALNGFFPTILTLDALAERVGQGWENYAGPALSLALVLGQDRQYLPGAMEDKLRLVDLGVKENDSALPRAVWELEQMRQIQPQGKLTQETIWKALFNGAGLPKEVASGAKTFAAALQEKHAADCQAMAKGLGLQAVAHVEVALSFMPWSTLAAMRQNKERTTLTLENMPGAGFLLPGEGGLKMRSVLHSLNVDPPRASGAGVKPPEVTFTFANGSTETIQFGPETNFAFADEQDKAAYLGGKDNSLARRLHTNCAGLAGGGDRQLRGAMLCMTQAPLILLKTASRLNGSVFDEHSPISVNLRPGPGGVRAEFSSPEGAEGTAGRFRMIIDIDNDGTMALRAFELTPPGVFRDQAIEARVARVNDAKQQAAPILALDDSPAGLITAMRQRLTLVSNPRLTEKAMVPVQEKIVRNLAKAARDSGSNLSLAQIWAIRDATLDEIFTAWAEAADEMPLDQRDAFIRAVLATGVVPKQDLVPVISQMASEVKNSFSDLLASTNANEARGILSELQSVMTAVTSTEEFADKGYGADEFTSARELAMHMGLMALMGQDDPETFALGLTRPGGPFRDMLYNLAHDPNKESYQNTVHAYNWFRMAMENFVSPETMDRLDMNLIRERDLSLARQKENLGQDAVVRGAGVAVPGLNDLNTTLPQDMPRIREHILTEAQKELIAGPPGQRVNNMSDSFVKDYPRLGVYVNGKYHSPHSTTIQDFKNLFPNPYVPEKLSNLAAQNLHGIVYGAMYVDGTLQRQVNNEIFQVHTAGNGDLLGLGQAKATNSIETLDESKGLYRVTAYEYKFSANRDSGVERVIYEVSVDVDLGPPNANPPPEPKVRNVQVDYLIRGRELAPGEQ